MKSMRKIIIVLTLFLSSLTMRGQTPHVFINGGLSGSGTISLRIKSASTGYDQTLTYDISQSFLNQSLELSNLPAATDYEFIVVNASSINIAYRICQAGNICDANISRFTACEVGDNQPVDGLNQKITNGQNYYLATGYKVLNNAVYNQTCTSNGGTNSGWNTGGIYVSFFNANVSQMFTGAIYYTDGILYFNQCSCTPSAPISTVPDKIHVYVNGVELTQGITILSPGYGLYRVKYPFGAIKPGDVITASNDCGDLPPPLQIVRDVYYYLEVPDGSNYQGNHIAHDDTLSPTARLLTPVKVKQCTSINLNAHFLAMAQLSQGVYSNGLPLTSGVYKLNVNPIKAIDFDFIRLAVSAKGQINADGTITGQYDFGYYPSNKSFVPKPLVTLEYTHNGTLHNGGEISFNILNSGFAQISNGTFALNKYYYDDWANNQFSTGTPTTNYKLTFDGSTVRYYVNNVKIDSVEYQVKYEIIGGSGTLSSTSNVSVGTPVTFIPKDTGSYFVQATYSNGVQIRQAFQVKINKPYLLPTDTTTIYTNQQLTVLADSCNGTIHWGTANSTNTGNFFQIRLLRDTTLYTYCESTTGCVTYPSTLKIKVKTPRPFVNTNKSDLCAGELAILTANGCGGTVNWSTGQTGISINVSPLATTFYSATCIDTAGTSPPKTIKITVE
jgi:hypothetical protein